MKTKKQGGTTEAVEQLNKWSKSEVTVRLIVHFGPFVVYHFGCVRKFSYGSFYLKPNGGGGMFVFQPRDGQSTLERYETATTVSFSEGGVSLSLQECLPGASGAEKLEDHAEMFPG